MKWISVDSNLPHPCEDILMTDGTQVCAGWLETTFPQEKLSFINGFYPFDYLENVTYWMYFPKPPKKE